MHWTEIKKRHKMSLNCAQMQYLKFADLFLFEDLATGWKCRSASCDVICPKCLQELKELYCFLIENNEQITLLFDIFDSTSGRRNRKIHCYKKQNSTA